MAEAQAPKTATATKKARQRSPNYPAIGLRAAVEKVKLLHDADRRAGAPVDAALKHMGFSSQHGQAMTVLSALKKFGLVDETGGRVVPTQRAIDILTFPDENPRKTQALREAGLSPDIYAELYDRYKPSGGIPSEETLKAELIADKHFNPNSVDGFMQDLKDTLVFAGLMNSMGLFSSLEDTLDMTDSVQTTMPAPGAQSRPPTNMKEISVPVGLSDDGEPIYAHVRFDAPLKKGMLSSLRALLDAVEKTLN